MHVLLLFTVHLLLLMITCWHHTTVLLCVCLYCVIQLHALKSGPTALLPAATTLEFDATTNSYTIAAQVRTAQLQIAYSILYDYKLVLSWTLIL
jgi:hypothetical protein